MTVSYDVHVEGLDRLNMMLARYPQVTTEELTDAHRDVIPTITSAIRGEMRRPTSRSGGVSSTPIYRGTTINAIGGRVESIGGGFLALGGEVRTVIDAAASAHAVYPEIGRRPGRFPPMQAMRDWVRVKLNVPESEVNSVAFLVGRKIARKGYQGYFFFARGWQKAKPFVMRRFHQALSRIVGRIARG